MKLKDHENESITLFGKPFTEIHKWLDEYAGSEQYGMRHRKIRHHRSGINEAIRIFGDEAKSPATQHIISDLKEEGWTENDHFPENEEDYVSMGLW